MIVNKVKNIDNCTECFYVIDKPTPNTGFGVDYFCGLENNKLIMEYIEYSSEIKPIPKWCKFKSSMEQSGTHVLIDMNFEKVKTNVNAIVGIYNKVIFEFVMYHNKCLCEKYFDKNYTTKEMLLESMEKQMKVFYDSINGLQECTNEIFKYENILKKYKNNQLNDLFLMKSLISTLGLIDNFIKNFIRHNDKECDTFKYFSNMAKKLHEYIQDTLLKILNLYT
jgi:hypothetical protein